MYPNIHFAGALALPKHKDVVFTKYSRKRYLLGKVRVEVRVQVSGAGSSGLGGSVAPISLLLAAPFSIVATIGAGVARAARAVVAAASVALLLLGERLAQAAGRVLLLLTIGVIAEQKVGAFLQASAAALGLT